MAIVSKPLREKRLTESLWAILLYYNNNCCGFLVKTQEMIYIQPGNMKQISDKNTNHLIALNVKHSSIHYNNTQFTNIGETSPGIAAYSLTSLVWMLQVL